jgi:hypothetical protein
MDLSERLLALSSALFDSLLKLGIGLGELGGPFGDPLFELRVQPLELPRLAIELQQGVSISREFGCLRPRVRLPSYSCRSVNRAMVASE